MAKKEDLRVRKTKKALYEGLINLMKDNTFENIKVSDICNKSLVNRSTFYDHFTDKYDLLNTLLNDLQIEFSNRLYKIKTYSSAKEYYLCVVKELFSHIRDNINVYSSIIKKNNNSVAFDMIENVINENATQVITEIYGDNIIVPLKILTTFYIPAVISVCTEFLNNPNMYTEEEIISYLDKLIIEPKK